MTKQLFGISEKQIAYGDICMQKLQSQISNYYENKELYDDNDKKIIENNISLINEIIYARTAINMGNEDIETEYFTEKMIIQKKIYWKK